MKLIDALKNVNKSEENEARIPWDDFCRECEIYDYIGWSDDTRLKGYWLKSWICTDTVVGYAAYYLDNALVAVSRQTARKNDIDVFFVSNEDGYSVRDYLLTLLGHDDIKFNVVSLDMDFWED